MGHVGHYLAAAAAGRQGVSYTLTRAIAVKKIVIVYPLSMKLIEVLLTRSDSAQALSKDLCRIHSDWYFQSKAGGSRIGVSKSLYELIRDRLYLTQEAIQCATVEPLFRWQESGTLSRPSRK